MKRFLIGLGLAGVVVGAFVLPAAHAGPLEDQFFQMDTSRDGAISRAEFLAYQTANGATERRANFAFENLRGDNDRVSLDEFRAGPSAARQAPERLERRSGTRQDTRGRNRRQGRPNRQPVRRGRGS